MHGRGVRRRKRAADREATEPLYEIGAVARATGEPRPLLKSWAEQGILVPAIEASGTGSRRWFDRPTAIKAAILVELRRLFGTRLQLGEIGKVVATADPDLIDRRQDPARVLLIIYRHEGRLAEDYVHIDTEEGLRKL